MQPLYADAIAARANYGRVLRTAGLVDFALHVADASTQQILTGKRIEAGYAVTLAEQSDWPSYDAFISDYMNSSIISIAETTTTRTIQWQYQGTMEASMQRNGSGLTGRLANGSAPPAELATCDFATQLPTTGTITIRGTSVTGVPQYGWVVYPAGSPTLEVVNPSCASAAITTSWSASPVTLPAYSISHLAVPPPARVPQWDHY